MVCSFEIKPHNTMPYGIVEIRKNGILIGSMYPTEEGIKIVGRSLSENTQKKIEIETNKLPNIPAVLIKLI